MTKDPARVASEGAVPCDPARDPRAVLRAASLRPKKSFGQNFLVENAVARAIAEACVPDAEVSRARVVELGAGTGALTAMLLPRAKHLVAVERDRDLVPILSQEFEDARARSMLEIVEADAQSIDLSRLLGEADAQSPRVLTGNLPYQITGRLLQLATTQSRFVDRVVFMVQREVADRLLASPSSKDYGALTVFVRAAFDVERVMNVSPGCFFPPPDVTSAVVRMTALRPARAEETPAFRALVRGAFESRRKTLRNAWRNVAAAENVARAAEAAGVSLDARGETLDVAAFARVAAALEGQ
jgi:16S rRNA (adenine1518-N6/adenine1519-N6)-dimethyltransferase